jgi:glycosyltransferase involved in cell wall biosynthesis
MHLTLAITTYDRPDALAAVLASVERQIDPPDEIIVADDGSAEETVALITRFGRTSQCTVRHVRQEHMAFRAARLRNLAIARMHGDYVVFIDGDMLLHPHFVGDHRRGAQRGTWVQGVRIRLDAAATQRMLERSGRLPGTASAGLGILRRSYAWRAPRVSGLVRRAANAFIAIKGCNQGFWREDLLAVNGYDEEIIGWGPEDKELCARLANRGVERTTLLFGGIAWHLHHAPSSRERRAVNEAVLARTRSSRLVRCAHGLDGHQSEG